MHLTKLVFFLGQHLLSAILERDQIETLSWCLGTDVSYIEIDSNVNLTQDKIQYVERFCNEAIAAATPVNVHILHDKDENDVPPEVKPSTNVFIYFRNFI